MIIELSKGYQVTIPAAVRHRHDIKPGTRFELEERDDEIVLRPVSDSWDDLWKEVDRLPPVDVTPEELDDFADLY